MSAALAVTWWTTLPFTGVTKLVFVVTSRFYVYLVLLVLNSNPLSSSTFNQLGTKVINLTILYLSRFTVTFASVTSVTIVMTATSLGIPSENKLDSFITTFQLLEFQLGSVSWYQEGTSALPPWHPTSADFHQSTLYPLVNRTPSIGLLA